MPVIHSEHGHFFCLFNVSDEPCERLGAAHSLMEELCVIILRVVVHRLVVLLSLNAMRILCLFGITS